jgi:hypothetical protein
MSHFNRLIPTEDGNYVDSQGNLIFDEDGKFAIDPETGRPYYQSHALDDPETDDFSFGLNFKDVFRTDLRDAGGHQMVIAELDSLEGVYLPGGVPVNRTNFGFDSRLKYVSLSQPFFTTPDFDSKATQTAFEWGIDYAEGNLTPENQAFFDQYAEEWPEDAAFLDSISPYPWSGLIFQDPWKIQAQIQFSYLKWPTTPSYNSEAPAAKAAYEASPYWDWYPASGWRMQVFVPEYEPVYDENDPDGDPIGSRKLGTFTELPGGMPMTFFKHFPIFVMAIGA